MNFGGAAQNITQTSLSFFILDSVDDISFIAVQKTSRPYGNLFQSPINDVTNYWVSLENIRIPSSGVDYYRTEGKLNIL